MDYAEQIARDFIQAPETESDLDASAYARAVEDLAWLIRAEMPELNEREKEA